MKVQELLSSEDKWTQKAYAKDKYGMATPSYSSNAVKWCLLGAVQKCYPSEVCKIASKIVNLINVPISDFNDTHSYEEVMELVRRLNI